MIWIAVCCCIISSFAVALAFSYRSHNVTKDEKKVLSETIDSLTHEKANTEKLLYETQKNLELKIQEIQVLELRAKDWEASKNESITQAKAAIFETASKLTEQLLEQHKTETKEAEQRVSETAKALQNQFESIVKNVAVLNNDIKVSKDTVDYIKTALLSPSGAGSLAEITLENILKASGLEPERDFFMQYSFSVGNASSERLRPDAVVFLPGNNMLLIDSKASKYFLELFDQTKSEEERKVIEEQLKNTMNNHLKNLKNKEYKEFLLEHFKDRKINHISAVMFLPSETSIEKLSSICKDFMQKAWEKDIFPMGPTGLINALVYAKFQIAAVKQSENQKVILDEVRKLLSSLMVVHEHARKVGTSIHAVCNNFDKFAASFNSNLLPKARNIEKLGVSTQTKTLPGALDRLTVISTEKSKLIEAESEECEANE